MHLATCLEESVVSEALQELEVSGSTNEQWDERSRQILEEGGISSHEKTFMKVASEE